MEETTKINNENINDLNEDYLKQIDELKRNSVSKERYDKQLEENRRLLQQIVNNDYDNKILEKEMKKPKDIDKLRKDLLSPNSNLNNLEFVTKSLELREAIMEEKGIDIFCPNNPTNEDYEAANRVAKIYKETIDYANGNPEVFTNELMRRTIDSTPTIKRKER